MNLTPEQICAIAQGALRTEVIDGAVTFHRFTSEQEALYARVRPDFFEKTPATSCIRLELRTDAKEITVSYTAKTASSRSFCYVDVFVNGVMLEHFGHEHVQGVESYFSVKLPEGENTVTVYLPGLFAVAITELSLDDGASLAPVKRPLRMLAFGDSITQGYDAHFPSQSYVNLLADKLGAEVTNFGIGGEVFRPELITDDINAEPDLITVAYGTNDWSKRTHEELVAASAAFYANLRAAFPRAKIFALTPIWRGDIDNYPDRGSFEDAREAVRAAARAVNAAIIEGDALVPHVAEAFDDSCQLHPNDLGFKFYANNLANAILPLLNKEAT